MYELLEKNYKSKLLTRLTYHHTRCNLTENMKETILR